MSLAAITLPTNKSMTLVNNNRRTVRQDEKGLSIVVTILDANGADYDLSGKDLEFCERKVSSKVVVDDGTDQDSDKGGKFELDADNKGTFTYTLPRQAYAASGTCWFTIKQGDSVIDTTKDFYLDVDDEASINLSDDNYASSFEAQLTYYKSLYSKANDTLNSDHQQYVDGLNEYKQNFDDLKAQWAKQTADIQTAANQQIADAKQAASGQLASDTQAAKDQRDSEASTFSSTLQDQIKQIESARDAAIQQANDDFSKQRDQLASDFADWEKQQQDSWAKTLADIQAHVNELQNTDIPGMDAKVKDLQAKIAQAEQDAQDAIAKFNSIDITKYELKSDLANDYYNKTEVDGKLTTVGTVKTVDKIQPDNSGNVDLQPEFNSLLGRNNLLTDDEMDISKATKSTAAQNAISNEKYANGISTFHYCGVVDYERVNWKVKVQPNTNYELIIVANSTKQLTALDPTNGPYIPFNANSSADLTDASKGDLGTCQLKLPWQGIETAKILFNSKNYSEIYLTCNFGFANDGVNTDITLQTTLLKSDSIQSQIDNLQNTVNNINSTRMPLVAGASGDDLFAFKTNQIRLYNNNGAACKNLPPASNTNYFTVQYLFEGPTDNGIAIYRTPSNEIWTAGCTAASYNTGWVRLATSTDITDLMSMQQTLQTTVSSNQTDIATIKNTLKDSALFKPITQADYDALSDDEKANGMYAIGDSN